MSSVDKGYRFGWTGEWRSGQRSAEQEEGIAVAQHLLTQINQIEDVLQRAPKAGLQLAKARIRRTALNLLFQNQADPKDVVAVLHDLAFDEAEAGFWSESREAAADTVMILLQFHESLQVLPEFGFTQRVQNMSGLLAELKQLSA